MKTVGLTGGIGSGKTTVAGFFRELGVPVFIADDEAKKLMHSDPELISKIKILFGAAAYSDTGLNRKFLADQVFQDKGKLKSLNEIVHPAVKAHFSDWKKEQTGVYVIYEAAILFETGGYKSCDRTILVTAPYQVRIERLKKRDNSTEKEIRSRMANQWDDAEKLKFADFVLENNNFSESREKVLKLHQIILNTP